MNTQEINTTIQRLKESNSEATAYFGFFQYGVGRDESNIKANKEGLRLYAANLLEVSLEIDEREFKENKKEFFTIPEEWLSKNSEFCFEYVELFQQSKTKIEPDIEYKETWKDLLVKYIFIGVLIFILMSILVGAITIIGWLF
ncbi:hypothetical protein WNY78_11520 [Psychroserpens sp. AS72]|uniref:hypothetical protein n=1 Tax=Psychroserpens sp. AS72 TaxID=3135775 RepID=UPI003180F54F